MNATTGPASPLPEGRADGRASDRCLNCGQPVYRYSGGRWHHDSPDGKCAPAVPVVHPEPAEEWEERVLAVDGAPARVAAIEAELRAVVHPEPGDRAAGELPQDRIAATRDLKEAAKALGFELREEFEWDDRTETGQTRFIVWDQINEWWADV